MATATPERYAELYAERARLYEDYTVGQYSSPHWEEKNVLAHIRMNDRKDADGNNVLFIEELQSDWAQAGRNRD